MIRPSAALLLCGALLSGGASTARAHSLAFGVLVVTDRGTSADAVLRASGVEGAVPDLSLRVSQGCEVIEERRSTDGALLVVRAALRCAESIGGARVTVEGLTETPLTIAATVRRGGSPADPPRFLDAAQPSFVVRGAPSALEVLSRYARLGLEHIASGLDHLAFVLALLLCAFDPRSSSSACSTRQRLAVVARLVTGFTLGHAVTLTLAAGLGARLPQPPVEALIALSIVFVSAELLRDGAASLTLRRPGAVAVLFGLLHGLGFAGALSSAGLPGEHTAIALLGFNVGVEVGQLAFVLAVVVGGAVLLRGEAPSQRARRVVAWSLAVVATVWSAARIDAIL